MNKKMLISIVCILLVMTMVIGAVILAVTNDRGADQSPPHDTHTEVSTIPTEPSETNAEDTTDKETLPFPSEEWFVPQPIPELDEGNEIYLDADVVAKLADMDAVGEEDQVNAILDGEILLINYFVKAGYTAKALYQIQRFYYAFYDNLKDEVFETLVEKITVCVDPEGACPFAFPSEVYETFGWGENTDFTYVFESEVGE